MPLYEFKCENCNALFERLVQVDTSFYDCPICLKPCSKVISLMAPPVIKNSTPYRDNITSSQKELDKRIGETINQKMRPIFEDREKEKAKFRQGVGESRLRRLPSKDPNEMNYVPANDQVVEKRKHLLKDYKEALSEQKEQKKPDNLK